MPKYILSIFFCFLASSIAFGQESEIISHSDADFFGDEEKKILINDYTLIGANYGVTFANMFFNPTKYNRETVMYTNYASVTFTKYCKMFGSIPYFGLVLGLATGNEGFSFKPDPDTGEIGGIADGATKTSIKVYEIPAMAQIHLDVDPIKVMVNVGVYGGWRQSITREGPGVTDEFRNSFKSYENRWDYGLQGGGGLAIMLDPIEIHFNCLARWSWSSLYQPDYNSKYYYNYAYPLDIMATVGIHFQLTKRNGKTRKAIKKQAYDIVYGQQE